MGTKSSNKSRIVLQNRESLLYLKGADQWTPNVSEASSFDHVADANNFARRSKLSVLDIVMSFGDPRYDVRLAASTQAG